MYFFLILSNFGEGRFEAKSNITLNLVLIESVGLANDAANGIHLTAAAGYGIFFASKCHIGCTFVSFP